MRQRAVRSAGSVPAPPPMIDATLHAALTLERDASDGNEPHQFHLTSHSKSLVFAAKNAEEKRQWMEALAGLVCRCFLTHLRNQWQRVENHYSRFVILLRPKGYKCECRRSGRCAGGDDGRLTHDRACVRQVHRDGPHHEHRI